MLQKTLLGISSLALITIAACAQEDTDESAANESERMAETQPTSPEPTAEPQTTPPETQTTAESGMQILDASQVGTKEEAQLYAESEFKQADINRDGSVDKNEFLAYAVIRAPMEDPQEADEPAAAGEGDITAEREGDVAAAEEPATAEEQFAEISNGDDTISKSEMVETRVAQFEEADANGDEQLDSEERKEFVKIAELKPSSGTSL